MSGDDDLYVNAGDDFNGDTTYYPKDPVERRNAEETNADVRKASYPVLGDIAEWFERQLAQCDSIQNIQFDLTTINGVAVDRKLSVEVQLLAYAMLRQLLDDKFTEFKQYVPER